MLFALATAGADPFLISHGLVNAYAYLPERVMFLRSDDCVTSGKQSEPVTEIWALADGASLPSYVEVLQSDQVKRIALGKNQRIEEYTITNQHCNGLSASCALTQHRRE
jgi:hypothetical protein